MKTMVFDVPAESGGALTILNQYYDKAVLDKDNEYIFVVSVVDLKETDNIKVLKYPWIKKSWFHRLFFDNFIAPKIVKKYKPEKILSLQNVIVPNIDVYQVLYVHQPLPFINKKYKFTENKKYWIYQNIIGTIIKKSISTTDEIIVQTKWMKNEIQKYTTKNIAINPPTISEIQLNQYSDENNKTKKTLFFYPTSCEQYKNVDTIVKATNDLVKKGIVNFEVNLTIDINSFRKIYDNEYNLIEEYDLPINFLGILTSEEVYNFYSKSTLVFASSVETFGLPLLEARLSNCPIIANKTEFSKEILKGYEKANYYFENYEELSDLMKERIKKNNEIFLYRGISRR